MGLLDTILSTIDAKKRSAKLGIMDMLDNPQQWAGMQANRIQEDRYGGPENAQAMKQYLSKQPYDPKALTAANDALRNAAINESLGAVTAWHGSPHKFDKFDMSKIGSGEGSQAYGHGLYLADSPEVARSYAAMAYKPGRRQAGLTKEGQDKAALDAIIKLSANKYSNGDVNKLIPLINAHPKAFDNPDKLISRIGEYVDNNPPSFIYKVDIPDEAVAKFLDWDKPLSQQAPEVQSAISKMRDKFPISKGGWDIKPWMDADPLASTWHNEAVRELGVGQDFFTKNLSENGVLGIRYLDGGSRSVGQGSSNYVLFDDQLPRIIERNGQPTGLQPWDKGEWKGLLDEPAAKVENATANSRLSPYESKGVSFSIGEGKDSLNLSKIVVDKEKRGEGVGTSFMNDLLSYADESGKKVTLSPSADFGGSKSRLKDFYKRFGFVENKGRNKDFTTMESMYREPKGLLSDTPVSPKLTEFEQRHLTAQKNAALPVEQGGLGLPEGNTAMDRARAMGMEDSYHGATKEIDQIDNSKVGSRISSNPSSHLGFFSTPNVKEASRYATDFGKEGANVMPLMVRRGNSFDMPNKQFDDLSMGEFFSKGSTPQERYANAVSDVNSLKDSLVSGGYDSITRFKGRPMEEIVSMNPANIRSRFAAFDPKRRHEADLLGYADPYLLGSMGAGGLLGMGGYSMMNDK